MEFNYFLPVNLVFGSGKVLETGELAKPYGKKALIVTGRSSAKRSGLYDKVNDSLKAAGLDGIEAIYSTYTTGEEQLVKRIAKENNLLISGGSDFHGENKPAIKLGIGRGQLYIPYSVLEAIKIHAGK